MLLTSICVNGDSETLEITAEDPVYKTSKTTKWRLKDIQEIGVSTEGSSGNILEIRLKDGTRPFTFNPELLPHVRRAMERFY